MKILGISAYYHDSAIAIIEDEKILFAIQEERLSRKKGDERFPALSIKAACEFLGKTAGHCEQGIASEAISLNQKDCHAHAHNDEYAYNGANFQNLDSENSSSARQNSATSNLENSNFGNSNSAHPNSENQNFKISNSEVAPPPPV